METVDREAMANALFPVLLRRKAEGVYEDWLRRVPARSAAPGTAGRSRAPATAERDTALTGLLEGKVVLVNGGQRPGGTACAAAA